MEDNFTNQLNGTENRTLVAKTFEADDYLTVAQEFLNYLWNCGYTYVDDVIIKTKHEE
jgi:hypothetical protein